MYPLRRQDIWIQEQSGEHGQASQQGPLEWKQIAGPQQYFDPSLVDQADWRRDIETRPAFLR